MKTMLSIPRTISITVSVTSPIQADGSFNQSIKSPCFEGDKENEVKGIGKPIGPGNGEASRRGVSNCGWLTETTRKSNGANLPFQVGGRSHPDGRRLAAALCSPIRQARKGDFFGPADSAQSLPPEPTAPFSLARRENRFDVLKRENRYKRQSSIGRDLKLVLECSRLPDQGRCATPWR
jgi:hypothetical protein